MYKILIEINVYVGGGLSLSIVLYHMEGYNPPILSYWIIFECLDSMVGTDIPFPSMKNVLALVKHILRKHRIFTYLIIMLQTTWLRRQ